VAIPGKPGCLNGEDSTGPALTDLGKKCLETPALNAPAA